MSLWKFLYGCLMLFEIFLKFFYLLFTILFGILLLSSNVSNLIISLFFNISKLFFEFKLDVQQLVDNLSVQFLQLIVRNLIQAIDLIWIIFVYSSFLLVFFLNDNMIRNIIVLIVLIVTIWWVTSFIKLGRTFWAAGDFGTAQTFFFVNGRRTRAIRKIFKGHAISPTNVA